MSRGPDIIGSATLNSLAEVLRQAQPLYRECRSILNYLDETAKSASWQYLSRLHLLHNFLRFAVRGRHRRLMLELVFQLGA